jgi:hypothetical protein
VSAPRTASLDILNPHFTPDGGKVLQNFTTYWADQLAANPSLAQGVLTDAEYAASQQSAQVARMGYGNAVERLVAADIADPFDPVSRQLFLYTGGPRGGSMPDFINLLTGEPMDITTPAGIAGKAGRWYGGPGLITPTYTRPAGFTVFQ